MKIVLKGKLLQTNKQPSFLCGSATNAIFPNENT